MSLRLTVAAFGLAAFNLSAATNYVWQESPSPAPPYTNWASAAHAIQDAVDTAQPGDSVFVTNGVYAGGLAVTHPLALRSVNGPQFTVSLPLRVTFFSSAARLYTLQCRTNLTAFPAGSIWTSVPGQTDLPGSGAVLTLTDTNPPAPAFYRVSVRLP